MKLTVKNFGPIQKAEVDIKPMTVFVGPSNTGKSYLAMLIYSIFKAIERMDVRIARNSFEIKNKIYEKDEIEEIISDDEKFTELANKIFLQRIDIFREHWENEVLRCFGEGWEKINKQKNFSVSVEVSDDKNKLVIDLFSSGKDDLSRITPMFETIKKQTLLIWNGFKNTKFDAMLLLSYLIEPQFINLLHFSPKPTQIASLHDFLSISNISTRIKPYYLPAERGGLMQSHRILVRSLIDRAPTIGLTGAEIVLVTGVFADFLNKLIHIDGYHLMRGTDEFTKLAQKIEQKILHGQIKTKISETNYPDFRYQFEDKNKDAHDISLLNASSSVSELSPIILFIRYYLYASDVFIVEEPEAHLHPEAQRIIAGVLVELVNAGVYVIVTTHSDIILEQISNFIYADKIPEAKVLNKKAKGHTLSKDKSGLYWFNRPARNNKTIVRPVPFDEETGMLTKDHLDVSSNLYNETVDLFNARERIAEKGREDDI